MIIFGIFDSVILTVAIFENSNFEIIHSKSDREMS